MSIGNKVLLWLGVGRVLFIGLVMLMISIAIITVWLVAIVVVIFGGCGLWMLRLASRHASRHNNPPMQYDEPFFVE